MPLLVVVAAAAVATASASAPPVGPLPSGATKTVVVETKRTFAAGKTSLVLALTRGERPHAYAARTFLVTVR